VSTAADGEHRQFNRPPVLGGDADYAFGGQRFAGATLLGQMDQRYSQSDSLGRMPVMASSTSMGSASSAASRTVSSDIATID
jgi:hypothetical protein